MDDFADHPLSLAEVRAERNQKASDWSPRDVLLSLLREIDRGDVKPVGMVVAFFEETEPGVTQTRFRAATRNAVEAVGVLEIAKQRLWDPD